MKICMTRNQMWAHSRVNHMKLYCICCFYCGCVQNRNIYADKSLHPIFFWQTLAIQRTEETQIFALSKQLIYKWVSLLHLKCDTILSPLLLPCPILFLPCPILFFRPHVASPCAGQCDMSPSHNLHFDKLTMSRDPVQPYYLGHIYVATS